VPMRTVPMRTVPMRIGLSLLLVGMVAVPMLATICRAADDAKPNAPVQEKPPPQPIGPPREADLKPEEVAKRFLKGVLTRDKAAITRWSVPTPDLDVLWSDPPLPEKLKTRAEKTTEKLTFRRLRVGETIELVGGEKYLVEEKHVNRYQTLILPEGFRIPLVVERFQDGWRVDASTWVLARKREAEEKAKQAAEGAKK
jgi:hypothetical protein